MDNHVLVKSTVAKAYTVGVIVLVMCLMLGFSCKGTATPATPPATLAANQVVIEGFAFKPDTLNITAGTTVTWRNNDSVTHTVTAQDNSFDSGSLPSGATFSYTFTKIGTSEYHCQIHPSMAGKVIVK